MFCLVRGERLSCDPPGAEIGEYSIPRPKGFEGISEKNSNYSSYNVTVSSQQKGTKYVADVTKAVEDNPTPGDDNAATKNGTRNDAGISPVPFGPLSDQVVSYVTKDSNGSTVVVNVSVPGEHVFNPAVVSQVIRQDENGTRITVVGESTNPSHLIPGVNAAAKSIFGRMRQADLDRYRGQ